MRAARVIVCERDGNWTAWLRGGLSSGSRVVQLRNLDECLPELSSAPRSVLCLEATPQNLPRIVDLMIEISRSYTHARVIVFACRQMQNFEWAWRAAGAVHVAFGYDQTLQAARITQRHLSSVPEQPRTFREQVLDRIPW